MQDGVEDVYMFLDDQEGTSNAQIEREELPSSVLTWMTKCYSALCDEEHPCYSYSCPRRVSFLVSVGLRVLRLLVVEAWAD